MSLLSIAIGLLALTSYGSASAFDDLKTIAEKLNSVGYHLNEYNDETQSLDLSSFADLFAAYETATANAQFPTRYTKDDQNQIVDQCETQTYDFQLFSELVANKAGLIKDGGYSYAFDHNITTTEQLDTSLRELYEAVIESEGNDDAASEIEQSADQIAQSLEAARVSVNQAA